MQCTYFAKSFSSLGIEENFKQASGPLATNAMEMRLKLMSFHYT